ncbi:hypothetical protein [Paenibacillus riograndensis]|uniref:hypothetical protein n=1 Tax=Paenibacillus riograndensis TaxID=483937 RepID=UPI0006263C86|nr:hypothetical protein [Paenibacillus riograndensis]
MNQTSGGQIVTPASPLGILAAPSGNHNEPPRRQVQQLAVLPGRRIFLHTFIVAMEMPKKGLGECRFLRWPYSVVLY